MSEQYLRGVLRRSDLVEDPIEQFAEWYRYAREHHAGDFRALALATASADGEPSVRMVLLKDFGAAGFVFATNYESRKGQDLAENPRAALLFFWADLERQIRIEGSVSRTTSEISDAIFDERPVDSRIAAITSRQSAPIGSREELQATFDRNHERMGSAPTRPANWGGFVLSPSSMEFWQGRKDRLHDRFVYRLEGGSWSLERLQP